MGAPMDFDVRIERVLLAHHFVMEPRHDMEGYLQGRGMDGLVCPITGGGEYEFPDRTHARLMPGEIALIPAEAAYRVRAADNAPFEHYTVNFLLERDSLPEWAARSKMHVLRPKDLSMYLSRLEELVKVWGRMRAGYRMQARARLLTLLADYLLESMTQNLDLGAYNRTLPAKRMIEARYSEALSLKEMAQSCGMCEGSFRRAFAQVYGQPPIAYLLNFRIEKAKELLLMGLPLEEVAQRAGFSDANYLIRYFRKATGMTPGRFRQTV